MILKVGDKVRFHTRKYDNKGVKIGTIKKRHKPGFWNIKFEEGEYYAVKETEIIDVIS